MSLRLSLASILCLSYCTAVLRPLVQPAFKLSLCQCVLTAINEYVNTNETITVASSITDYSNNIPSIITSNQIVLNLLTEETKWTILTTNMVKYTKPTTHYSLEKISRSYIIFVRKIGEISRNVKRLKTLGSWNPHSHFFIISATIFRSPFQVAYEILQTLWEEELLDGVILLANPKNTSVFNAYVSKPYVRGNCGKNLDQIEHIDSCTMGVFRKNTFLFRNNIPKRLNNCTLSVGFSRVEPYVMVIRNSSVATDEYYRTDGLEINLLNVIANYLELRLVYYKGDVGDIYLNGTATKNLLSLKEGKIDIAIGSYVKTFERSYYFDSSDTYIQDILMWCVPHSPILLQSHNFLKILDLTSWLLLLFLYLVVVSLLWFASSLTQEELTPYLDYKNVFQYVFSIFLGMPVRFQPRTLQIRIMFIMTVLFSFHLDSAYLSFLTSVLTGSQYGEKYSTPSDIYEHNLTTYFVPNSAKYFQGERFQYVLDKMIECDKYKECMDYVAFRRDSAFCVPKMYVDYIYNSYVTKSNDPLLHCFGNIVSMKTNMLMRKGFPLFTKINRLIGQLLAGGFIAKWRKDILSTRAGTFVGDIDIFENDSHFLKMKNLVPVFITLIVGHSVAFLVFVIELKCAKRSAEIIEKFASKKL